MTEEMDKEMRRLGKQEDGFDEIHSETSTDSQDIVEEEDVLEIKPEQECRAGASGYKAATKKRKIIIIVSLIILASILAVLIGIGLCNKFNSNVYRGVLLQGENLSGMSESEVVEYVKLIAEQSKARTISIEQDDEFLIEITNTDFDMHIDEDRTVENIIKYGRGKNLLSNNIDIITAMIKPKNIDVVYTYNEEKLTDIIKEVKESIKGKTIDDSYSLNEKENKLFINKGKAGVSINELTFKDDLIKNLTVIKKDRFKIQTIATEPNKIDVDIVHLKVAKQPKDAYVDKSSEIPKFIAHEVGLDFDKEELRNVIKNIGDNKSVEFKLNVTEPKVKLADITWDLYNYQVSTYKTYFATTDPNRVNNLGVALGILNGKVIMPGETFSYNATVGSASTAQGFKPASTFVGGNIVKEVGGGICQTVSTLYNAVLLANLEVVQRKNHSLPVGYVPGSRDATVYYPSVDFKFKNTRNYPLKIVTTFNAGGNLSISLKGTKEEVEPVVKISSKTLSYIAYSTQYIQDSSLAKGVQVIVKSGTNGYISEAYKTTTIAGKTTTVFLSKDTYKPVTKVVRIGTKVSAPVVTPPVEEPVVPVVTDPVVPPVTEPGDPLEEISEG